MRIDIHAYVGHWPFRQLRGSRCQALVQRMDRFGIDRAWVGNIHGIFYKNCQSANEELTEAAAPFRNRLIPFAVLNPTYADWEHDLDVCVSRLGMKGLRLYPQYHGYEAGGERCMALVDAARQLKLPVAFTTRLVDERQQSWLDQAPRLEMEAILRVMEKAPQGKYVVLHAFPTAMYSPEATKAVKSIEVVFDTIYGTGVPVGVVSAYPLAEAIQRLGLEKFAFGTATPFRDYISHLLRIEALDGLGAEEKGAIWSGNALRIVS